MHNLWKLCASLYVPATHRDLAAIANGHKLHGMLSVIFCTEDAVAPDDLEPALKNLATCLLQMNSDGGLLRFVRVRDAAILEKILAMPGVEKLDGFVFPKITLANLEPYFQPLAGTRFLGMPTLETAEVFDARNMMELRDHLLASVYRDRIPVLRIGGNDLLSILGIRRPLDMTIYRTPLNHTIAQLVTIFKPHGFHLTAPVFEHIERPDILVQEIVEDIAHGLCGKTAIHPSQVPLIESHYRVSPEDINVARRILEDGRAVFKHGGSMCETATHGAWARGVIEYASHRDFEMSVSRP